MTVRNVKKNLAGQQDLLPGVGPYSQIRRGVAVSMDGPAKSYIELWNRTLLEAGFTYAGTFEDGCTAMPGQCVVSLTAGRAYKNTGAINIVILIYSSPETSGGIFPSGIWEDIEDANVYTRIVTQLAASGGSLLVGYGSITVGEKLDSLTNSINSISGSLGQVESAIELLDSKDTRTPATYKQTAANWANSKKGVVVLGDSITHGAFAGNLYSNGITRLLARAFGGQVGSASYGFTPMLTLGSGPTMSTDIHSVVFTNAGLGWVAQDALLGTLYPNGFAFRSTNIGNAITFTVPSFMRRVLIHHANQVGGGTFTISINGTVVTTVTTASGVNKFETTEVAANDNGYGSTIITITTTTANPVDICGVSYLAGVVEPCLQNFSQSGRRARYVDNSVITEICQNCATLVFALGHNDSGETDTAYIASVTVTVDYLIAQANLHGVKVIVSDHCWSASASNWMRMQLKRLALSTNGVYVDFPSMLANPDGSPASSTRLITDLQLFTDGSHPNSAGNEFIFSTIAEAMGLSCTSKKEVLTMHDYWLSLPLKPATSVENSILSTPSACKRTPSGVAVRLFIELSPHAAFPVGTYILTDTYASNSDIGLNQSQTQTVAVMKLDGTAVAGGATIGADGQIILNVLAGGAVYNDLAFSVVCS